MNGINLDIRKAYFGSGADQFLVAGDMQADAVGTWLNVEDLNAISFDVSWLSTSSPVGTFFIRISNALAQPTGSSAGQDSGFSGWANPAGTAGSNFITIDLTQTRCKWIMLWYQRTSGGAASTLTCRVTGGAR